MAELIITEKPSSAFKIATALADKAPTKKSEKGVPYYELKHKDKEIIVACAVGHLYTVAEKKKSWAYPVFDVEWVPSSKVAKKSAYINKYLDNIKKLSSKSDKFTVATDYDIEGEVIGFNVIRFACKQKDANRMKYSTLTKPDLVYSYEHKSHTLDWGQANAGITRHELDWYYGINLSRALTQSIKSIGSFKIMSSGRVQGPALKIIVDREKEIRVFVPEPFWQIELKGDAKHGSIIAWHIKDKFWKEEEADKVLEKTKGQRAFVTNIEKTQFKQSPPYPFDLTTLQMEAYRCFRMSPKETQAIAQELYIGGFISYPRTSSQKLPSALGYKRLLAELAKQAIYSKLASQLLSKPSLRPNEGNKTDPAHPAIYPTGITPNISGREHKVYDLIVKRFLATFSDPATRETMIIRVECNREVFVAKGTRTVEKGWHIFYAPYVKLEEEELPKVDKDEEVDVKSIKKHKKETQPPKRYTPASIIKELEKRNLGTKATRSDIVDTLFQRGYVEGKAIQATELGIKTIETLEKYCARILDENLTKHFEEEMEEIREKKKKNEQVLSEAKEVLLKILKEFKQKEKEIGKELLQAERDTMSERSYIGKCPVCGKGDLHLRKGRFGQFIACNSYPECKTTFSIPNTAKVRSSKEVCKLCMHPMIAILKKNRAQEVCINKDCPSKKEGNVTLEKKAEGERNGKLEKECPKCKGRLVVRKSIYGEFLGCSSFPKCRYTEKINNGPLKEDIIKKKN